MLSDALIPWLRVFVELGLIVGEAVDDSPWIRPSNKAMKLTGRKGDERRSFCKFLSVWQRSSHGLQLIAEPLAQP